MATSLAEIEQFLKEEELKYTVMEEYVRTSFVTDNFTDADGDHSLFMVLKPEENGEYFKLIAPNLYSYQNGPHKAAVFEVLLAISWKTKLLQFEYDATDGEIRAIVEFPLEDAPLTRKQLMRCVNGMVQIIDEYHPVIHHAMLHGTVNFAVGSDSGELEKTAEEIYKYIGFRPEKLKRDGKLELEE